MPHTAAPIPWRAPTHISKNAAAFVQRTHLQGQPRHDAAVQRIAAVLVARAALKQQPRQHHTRTQRKQSVRCARAAPATAGALHAHGRQAVQQHRPALRVCCSRRGRAGKRKGVITPPAAASVAAAAAAAALGAKWLSSLAARHALRVAGSLRACAAQRILRGGGRPCEELWPWLRSSTSLQGTSILGACAAQRFLRRDGRSATRGVRLEGGGLAKGSTCDAVRQGAHVGGAHPRLHLHKHGADPSW